QAAGRIRKPDRASSKIVQRGAEADDGLCEIVGRKSEPNSEMIGHLEPAAGHDRCVVPRAQVIIELLRVAARQAGEGRNSVLGRSAFQVVAALDEIIEQLAV